jgi:CheY-like chemotaxis protein
LAEPRTVLIADPCAVNADTLAAVLAACGHRVRTAGTAADALALAAAHPPDVLITEAALPDLDGPALAAQVAAGRAVWPRLVLLTGRVVGGGWAGFDRVFVKPADPEALVRLVAGSPRTGAPDPSGPAADTRVSPQEGRMATAEERAAELVAVTCSEGGVPRWVELRGPGLPPVSICHFPNPARVREAAAAVRAFVAAVLREAAGHRATAPDGPLAT